MATRTVTLAWSNGAETFSKTVSVSADGETNIDIPVPDSSTDLKVVVAIDQSEVALLYMSSTAVMKVETNSSSAPDDTINLAAETPIVWIEGGGMTNVITKDVTALYLTTGAVGASTFTLRCSFDPTP